MTSTHAARKRKAHPVCNGQPKSVETNGRPLNQSKVTEYQPPDKGPSTLSTAQKRTVYEQEHFEKQKSNPLCGTHHRRNRLRLRAGKRHRGHQRSHLYGEFLFRPRHETDIRHRRGRRAYRGRESLWQVFIGRPRHQQDSRLVVRRVHLPDCCRHHPALILPLINNVWLNTR